MSPAGPGGRKAHPPRARPRGVFKKKTETPTTSPALAQRPSPPARPPPTFAALPAAGRPRTCLTMSLARQPKNPLSRAPRNPSRALSGARRPSAPPAGLAARDSSPPPPLRSPTWRGPRVRLCTKGRGVGARAGGASAPAGTRRRSATPSPETASPSRLPARNYLPPRLRIQPPRLKFTLAGREGSGFPLHGPAVRLTLPRASSRIRAGEAALRPGRPFLPGRAGGPPK